MKRKATAAAIIFCVPFLLLPGSSQGQPGADIFHTTDDDVFPVTISEAGWYYLAVAADSDSEITARLFHETELVVEKSSNYIGAIRVELDATGYELVANGSGSVAVAWDFQNPGTETFRNDVQTVLFLRPQGNERLQVTLNPGTANSLRATIYDAFMWSVYSGSVSEVQTITVDLAPTHSDFAYVVVNPSGGDGSGTYSVSWSSGKIPPAFAWGAVGIGVAILLILGVALYVANRRQRKRPRR